MHQLIDVIAEYVTTPNFDLFSSNNFFHKDTQAKSI